MTHAEIRPRRVDSWLDPATSKRLAFDYGNALDERFRGRRGLFVTLTYARDPYSGPVDLYRKQREQRHIRHYIRRLAKFLGHDLNGRWFCKMEFQGGKWVHWHLAIDTPHFVPKAVHARLWPYGFSDYRALTAKNVRYICKYISAADDCPDFLYFERPRSVKIVRVSSGFWTFTDPHPLEPHALSPPTDFEPSPDEDFGKHNRARPQPPPYYAHLGDRLIRSLNQVTVNRSQTLPISMSDLLCACSRAGASMFRRYKSSAWIVCGGIPAVVTDSIRRNAGEAAQRRARFDLNRTGKPRTPSESLDHWQRLPWVRDALTSMGVLQWSR